MFPYDVRYTERSRGPRSACFAHTFRSVDCFFASSRSCVRRIVSHLRGYPSLSPLPPVLSPLPLLLSSSLSRSVRRVVLSGDLIFTVLGRERRRRVSRAKPDASQVVDQQPSSSLPETRRGSSTATIGARPSRRLERFIPRRKHTAVKTGIADHAVPSPERRVPLVGVAGRNSCTPSCSSSRWLQRPTGEAAATEDATTISLAGFASRIVSAPAVVALVVVSSSSFHVRLTVPRSRTRRARQFPAVRQEGLFGGEERRRRKRSRGGEPRECDDRTQPSDRQ